MIGGFTFKGIHVSEFNLIGRSVKRPLLPAANIRRTELALASGAFDFKTREYALRQVTMRVTYIGKDYMELRKRARQLAAWLATEDWEPLILDDEPDLYYLAKVTGEIDLESFWESGTAEIVFDCQPFAMSLDEVNLDFPSDEITYTFTNPGTRHIDSKSPPGAVFQIRFQRSGDQVVGIRMNDKLVVYYEPETGGTITIDCVLMTVTNDGQHVFGSLRGDVAELFAIKPGDNTICIYGSTIGPVSLRYIPLWY